MFKTTVVFCEWNDCDRWPELRHGYWPRLDHRPWSRRTNAIGADGFMHMLEVTSSQVLDIGIQHRRELVANIGRHNNLAWPRQSRKPGSEINICPVDIMFVGEKVPDMSALADKNMQILRDAIVDVRTRILNGKGSFDCEGRMSKFHEQPITEAFYEPALVARQNVFIHSPDELPLSLDRAGLVLFHQAHRLNDVHKE